MELYLFELFEKTTSGAQEPWWLNGQRDEENQATCRFFVYEDVCTVFEGRLKYPAYPVPE